MLPARKNYSQEWLPNFFNDFFDNDWLSARTNGTAPAINVLEEEKLYKVEAAVPGMRKEDFNIRLTDDNLLVISMEKKEDKEEKEKKYLRREFSYTKFEQSLILPEDVEKDRISASVNDGILTIELPKMTPEEKKQACKVIEIH